MIKYPPCSNDFQFSFNFHHKISPETAGNKINNKNGTKKKKKKLQCAGKLLLQD